MSYVVDQKPCLFLHIHQTSNQWLTSSYFLFLDETRLPSKVVNFAAAPKTILWVDIVGVIEFVHLHTS